MLLILVADNTAFMINKYISFVDFAVLAAVWLIIKGERTKGYVFMFVLCIVRDSFYPNVPPLNTASGLGMVVVVTFLDQLMYKDDFRTKIFMFFSGAFVYQIIKSLLSWISYWEGKVYFINLFPLVKVFFTVLMAAVLIKGFEIFRQPGKKI